MNTHDTTLEVYHLLASLVAYAGFLERSLHCFYTPNLWQQISNIMMIIRAMFESVN